jgi:hypothetical protein
MNAFGLSVNEQQHVMSFWSGITEDYTVGWADVTKYFLTNNISGAWCGSFLPTVNARMPYLST